MHLPYANVQMSQWNPGATQPLILPIQVICNTSDDEINNNIKANSRSQKKWLNASNAHNGIAVLCGSGPSLADTLDDIRGWQQKGAKVFAMNGAAQFLNEHGIFPDYQVIIDAREQTADLVGPAKQYLFASQVHPKCFQMIPEAILYHLQVEGIDDLLPDYDKDFCMIGGAASVGNTSTCLVYAMGFRNLQIYGYDSSHRGDKGHAFHQKMNDGDPCAVVRFNGKEYTSSLTMKLQAERFQDTARELKSLGCHIEVHGSGLLPDIYNSPGIESGDLQTCERLKYEEMWKYDLYRTHAPGEYHVERAVEVLSMNPGDTVIDFGCGTGRGAGKLQKMGFDVVGVDFAENCLDPNIKIPFVQACLWDMPQMAAKFGYCTDVMEHIPSEKVDEVLKGISERCESAYFNISTQDDVCGSLIGKKLHLTVQDAQWWETQLRKYWAKVVVLDSQNEATFAVFEAVKH